MAAKLLKDIIYNRIRDMIILGSLPMGAKLSEGVLAERLSATKAPVRDAIKRLASEGLVTIKPKSGTFVFSLTGNELNELLEFRYCIECNGMRLSHSRNKMALVQDLRSILDRMEICLESNNYYEYLRLDDKFHQALISHSENSYYLEAYALISSRMATIRTHMGGNEEHMQRSFIQHSAIINALETASIDEACEQLLCHISPEHGAYWQAVNIQLGKQ